MEHPRRRAAQPPRTRLAALLAAAASALAPCAAGAATAQWRLAQPLPPGWQGEPCETSEGACVPVGLGRVGDIEFWAPNRGLLITAGDGTAVPAGVWAYDGQSWHELADVCGATDGRIAWAGPEEFWTVSDERPGQPPNAEGVLPPLEDDTLCHFAYDGGNGRLEVVRSYAAPAFTAGSYQQMRAAACLGPTDCWFGGEALPAPLPGAFQLHWNGSSLEAQPNATAQSVAGIEPLEGRLLESFGLAAEEPAGVLEEPQEILHPYVLDWLPEEGAGAFEGLRPFSTLPEALPEYAPGSYPQALAGMQLSVAAEAGGGESLWAAAGPAQQTPLHSKPGALTALHEAGGTWTQPLGPPGTASAAAAPGELGELEVSSLAAEPETGSAWLALDTAQDERAPSPTLLATVVHVGADGTVTTEQLPTAAERAAGVAPKGAAAAISCPAREDCWLATTQGWLFHLSDEEHEALPTGEDPAFDGPLVTERPADEGLPPAPSTALPIDDSGEQAPSLPAVEVLRSDVAPPRETVPLLSDLRVRLLHRTTLQLSFRLVARARLRLLAMRRSKTVASSRARVFPAGAGSIRVRLDPRRWPTRLDLQSRALAPLPTVPARAAEQLTTAERDPEPEQAGGLGLSWTGTRR